MKDYNVVFTATETLLNKVKKKNQIDVTEYDVMQQV